MKPAVAQTRPNITYSSPLFDINVFVRSDHTYIFTKFFTDSLTTFHYPETHAVLKEQLPQVLETVCHNELNLPFCEEVKNTELAHLFEHIVIQLLANARESMNSYKDYSGETCWNWNEDELGVFHVHLSSNIEDMDIIEDVCRVSVGILNDILVSKVKAKQTRFTRLPARYDLN